MLVTVAGIGPGCTSSDDPDVGNDASENLGPTTSGDADVPWLDLSITSLDGSCVTERFDLTTTILGDEPDRVVVGLVRTDGIPTPIDEVHPLTMIDASTESHEFGVTLLSVDPAGPIVEGSSTRFTCDDLKDRVTQVVVALDAADRVADCFAAGGDAAGLFAGGYESARASGAFDALGALAASCNIVDGMR